MFAEIRKQMIVDFVNQKSNVTLGELCEKFSVSPATVRNDLRALEKEGLLKRTHGGAISIRKVTYEPNAYQKEIEHVSEKKMIAEVAFSMIEKGDSIALDTGTTTFELAKKLKDSENITVVTYDLQIASYLEEYSGVDVFLAGGYLRRDFHCTTGKTTLDSLEGLNVDKAFLGANGIDLEHGAMTPHLDTADIKEKIKTAANRVILLADSSKIGKSSFVTFCGLDEIDVFITDTNAPKAFISELEKRDIDVKTITNDKKQK